MILCLDVGNSQIFGGVFNHEEIRLRFRHDTTVSSTSDQLGIFLKSVLRENGFKSKISNIAICSVVPSLDYSLRSACIKYFNIDPTFLNSEIKTGLDLSNINPLEIGSDRLANAIAAVEAYPNKNLIVIDFGTATTFCVITKNKVYLGGAILPGMKLSMNALQANTAKLFAVEIIKPDDIIGKTTKTNIQAGLYYGQLGIIREFTQGITKTHFNNQKPIVIGTGGFSYLFENEGIFTTVMPDLILNGLRLMLKLNS